MKTIILAQTLIIAILGYFLFGNKSEIIKEEIEIVEVCEYIDNTKPTKVVREVIKVPQIIYKQKQRNIIHDTIYTHKEVNKFVYKDSLKNGFLQSTIWADSIYKRDIKLTTFDKEITRTVFKPTIYLGGSIASYGLKEANYAAMNVYLAKEKFLLGTGYGFDLSSRRNMSTLTVAFKIK